MEPMSLLTEKKLGVALILLDQIIEKSHIDDMLEAANNSKIAQSGDGWITHHLKLVKEVLTSREDLQYAETKE